VAEELSHVLGQPVLVENRPGAGATLAHELVAKAPADGYTLLIGVPGALTMAPSLYPKLNYDPARDFEPVGMTGFTPYVFVVHPDFPAKTLADVITMGKAFEGATLNYGSSGNGSSTHLLMERFKMMTGTKYTHVPYKGSVQALTDLLGGRLQVMIDSLTATAPYVKSGKLRALGISTAKPQPGITTDGSLQMEALKLALRSLSEATEQDILFLEPTTLMASCVGLTIPSPGILRRPLPLTAATGSLTRDLAMVAGFGDI
jgi:tripartite-type tricarboxylate transporter receptor subunit TctC